MVNKKISICVALAAVLISVALIMTASKSTGKVVEDNIVIPTLSRDNFNFLDESWLNGRNLCGSMSKVDLITLKFRLTGIEDFSGFKCDVYDNGVSRITNARMAISGNIGKLNTIKAMVDENHNYKVCCEGLVYGISSRVEKTNDICLENILVKSIC